MRRGRLHGAFTIFRPDGSVMQLQHYVGGLLEGEQLDLDPAGVVRRRAEYRAGRLDGTVTHYDAAGQPTAHQVFVADKEVTAAPPPGVSKMPTPQKPWLQRWWDAAKALIGPQ